MKGHWLRAGSWLPCGAQEDCRIEAGEPYLMIVGENWTKLRCEKHAGRPVPADVEHERHASTKPLGFSSVGSLARDWKRKQAGRDE